LQGGTLAESVSLGAQAPALLCHSIADKSQRPIEAASQTPAS